MPFFLNVAHQALNIGCIAELRQTALERSHPIIAFNLSDFTVRTFRTWNVNFKKWHGVKFLIDDKRGFLHEVHRLYYLQLRVRLKSRGP